MEKEFIEIDRALALKTFNAAPADGKVWLKKVLGDALGKITDRVKNFDDILAIAGTTMEELTAGCRTPREIADRQVVLIAEVYNEGDVLDPMNTNQYKYYPWFRITPGSGFGLSCYYYDTWSSLSYVGVRHCYKNSDLAIDAGEKFTEIYANLLIK